MANTSRPSWRPSWRFLLPYVAVHGALSAWLLVLAFSQGMDRFESGKPPTFAERAIEMLSDLLLSPVFKLTVKSRLLSGLLPGLLGWLPVLANSVVWAFLTWWLLAAVTRHFGRRSLRPLRE